MIRTALDFVQSQLETYMVNREQDPANYSPGNVVELKSIVLPDGTVNITPTTHVTIMLVNIEEERREGKRPYYVPTADGNYLRLNAPVELDLYILFVANNSDYETSLRDLADVVGFFQSNPVFDAQNYPSLNASVVNGQNMTWRLIERLSFHLVNLTFEQQNNLWGMLSSKYMPSAVYRARMLTVFETKSNNISTAITEIDLTEN